ncbi:chitinase [Paenibacillus lutrae]|uniref:Chitinase n=1 Tax=Paenibacillus lutrae TaxID=2078573 RepID=A0A7X3FLF4_9BACL|nr:chitinase [Paenibacillus lutrae]MVP01891.1 chitinase [Paenibacillus lutrae]
MSQSNYPFSKKFMLRTISLTLGAALLAAPLSAYAAQTKPITEAVPLTDYEFESAYHTGSYLDVGESRLLSDKQIRKQWKGIDKQYSPERAVEAVKEALPEAEYEALFPMRLGSKEWHEFNKDKKNYDPNQVDYYSYENLIQAVTEVANIKYKVSYRKGSLTAQEVFRLDKDNKSETLVSRSNDFNAPENRRKKIESQVVDFGTFLKEGSDTDRKRELAALLANLAHETGGGWDAAPGGPLRWGLYYNENIAGRTGANMSTFVDPDSSGLYPGVEGKRYYGRGPIMMSWNFNYGLFSSIIYGDKSVLLKNPEKLAADGKLGFMTAILFWMTPQAPKPSAHDVMVGRWEPTKEQEEKGLKPSGFGITVMVLNGLEANLGETDGSPIKRRAGHYRDITKRMGVDVSAEKIDTLGMKPF